MSVPTMSGEMESNSFWSSVTCAAKDCAESLHDATSALAASMTEADSYMISPTSNSTRPILTIRTL